MPKTARCPYFRKPCLEHECTHYVQLHGTDPQTGERLDSWTCLDHAMLKAQLEGNKEVRQGAAATESFRNEVVRGFSGLKQLAVQRVKGIIHAD